MAAFRLDAGERRVILLGKTGNGKSATGNTLLENQGIFPTGRRLTGVTRTCIKKEGISHVRGKKYVIVDTPGLLDTNMPLAEGALEIQKSVEICPKPHAFLLVFSATNRFTDEENFTIDLLRVIFGEKVFDNCIVVFTHGDSFKNEPEFRKFWTESKFVVELAKRCNHRITTIENSPTGIDPIGGDHILAMIEELCKHGENTYKYFWLDVHTKALKEHLKTHQGKTTVGQELTTIAQNLGKTLDREVWKAMLVGGCIAAAGLAGTGIVGYGGYLLGSAAISAVGSSAGAIANGAAAIGGTVIVGAWKLATSFKFR